MQHSSALAIALASIASIPILAQPPHPDLQGTWVNRSATPLERPAQLKDRQFLTEAEVAELKKRADRLFKDGNSDFAIGDDVFLAALANVERFKRATSTSDSTTMIEREFDNRTSLIVDPPDGKLPPYTPEGQRRLRALIAATNKEIPAASLHDLTNSERCITWGVPLLLPSNYTSHYQILQSPGYVVFVMEAIHDARIIPTDGRAHLPPSMRKWTGDSVGRWDGKTLIVDTANFSPNANFMGAGENLHLIERFTRVAPDEIRYEITVDDRTTWTKPWTVVLRLKKTEESIYELACHEGNFGIIESMLSAPR